MDEQNVEFDASKITYGLFEMAVGLLQMQISLGYIEDNPESNKRLTDRYSRGYIFGLCDALTQSANVNADDTIIALVRAVSVKFFGEENGLEYVEQSFLDQKGSMFTKGCLRGGQELFEFLRNKTPTTGLARYLLNGEMQ